MPLHRFLPLLLCLTLGFSAAGIGAEARRPTITDYFLQLPKKYFEVAPDRMLAFVRQPKCGVVDEANGFLSCIGDGAQAEFQVALFRYRDGRPLLAVSTGELEDLAGRFLDFFEQAKDGTMKPVPRTIFPLADGKDRVFELPRHGRTVVVREGKSGKVRARFTWDGEKFAEER